MNLRPYIGRPWRAGATGPEAYDCGGLVIAVQRAFWDRTVPPLTGVEAVRTCQSAGWAPTNEYPVAGDVLLVRAIDGPHLGTFVTVRRRLMVLHARSHIVRGVQIGRVDLHTLADLLACGYSRHQVWRFS